MDRSFPSRVQIDAAVTEEFHEILTPEALTLLAGSPFYRAEADYSVTKSYSDFVKAEKKGNS